MHKIAVCCPLLVGAEIATLWKRQKCWDGYITPPPALNESLTPDTQVNRTEKHLANHWRCSCSASCQLPYSSRLLCLWGMHGLTVSRLRERISPSSTPPRWVRTHSVALNCELNYCQRQPVWGTAICTLVMAGWMEKLTSVGHHIWNRTEGSLVSRFWFLQPGSVECPLATHLTMALTANVHRVFSKFLHPEFEWYSPMLHGRRPLRWDLYNAGDGLLLTTALVQIRSSTMAP